MRAAEEDGMSSIGELAAPTARRGRIFHWPPARQPVGQTMTSRHGDDSDGDVRFLSVALHMRDAFDEHELPLRSSVVVEASRWEEALERSGDIFMAMIDRDDPPGWALLETLTGALPRPGHPLLNWYARKLLPGCPDQCLNAEDLVPMPTQQRIAPEQLRDRRLRPQQFECVAFVFEASDHIFDPHRSPIRRSCVLRARDESEAYATSDKLLTGGSEVFLNCYVRPAVPEYPPFNGVRRW